MLDRQNQEKPLLTPHTLDSLSSSSHSWPLFIPTGLSLPQGPLSFFVASGWSACTPALSLLGLLDTLS